MMVRDPLVHELDLSVLVTCYNEEAFITDTLDTVSAALKQVGLSWEIIVIDDCSRDRSRQVLEGYVAAHPDLNIRLCPNEKNRGLASNFIEGAYLAKGRYYRLCCGDNSESTEALVHIFRHIGKADLLIPHQVQRDVEGKSALRKRISGLFTGIINLLSGNSIGYYNGLPVYLRYLVMRFPPQSYGFGFQADIVTRLLEEDITFAQTKHLGAIDRKGRDATALSMRNLLSVIHTMFEIVFRRLRRIIYGKGMPRAREVRVEG